MKKRNFLYPDSYQTGDTRPPEKKQWITLFVLAGLILLSSVLICLSFLFPQLFSSPSPTTVAYAKMVNKNEPNSSAFYGVELVRYEALGFTGQIVPSFFRMYYEMPAGIYITAVDEEYTLLSPLLPGDIVISCQGQIITSHFILTSLLQSIWDKEAGKWTEDAVIMEVYRKNRVYELYISLG